jgi:hypothetical protein
VPSAPRQIRFAEFIRRLESMPLATSGEQVRKMIDATLNRVEDELSGVPYNPSQYKTDGRFYPVQDDNVEDYPGVPGVKLLRSRKHFTHIRDNGAFEIVDANTGIVVIEKLGSDGKGVWT